MESIGNAWSEKALELADFQKADKEALEQVMQAYKVSVNGVALDLPEELNIGLWIDREVAEAFVEQHAATDSQASLKRHPSPMVRRANIMARRATAAAIADQEIARREPSRQKRAELAAEVRKLAAEAKAKAAANPDDEAAQADWIESRGAARAVLRSLDALQRAADATPLFALRSEKHDVDQGSRAIRRKVSHDFRKGRKPDPDNGRGSVPLDAADLIELHGRFAANVLGIEGYNAALAEAQKIGKLKHLVPLVAKKAAEAVSEEREAA